MIRYKLLDEFITQKESSNNPSARAYYEIGSGEIPDNNQFLKRMNASVYQFILVTSAVNALRIKNWNALHRVINRAIHHTKIKINNVDKIYFEGLVDKREELLAVVVALAFLRNEDVASVTVEAKFVNEVELKLIRRLLTSATWTRESVAVYLARLIFEDKFNVVADKIAWFVLPVREISSNLAVLDVMKLEYEYLPSRTVIVGVGKKSGREVVEKVVEEVLPGVARLVKVYADFGETRAAVYGFIELLRGAEPPQEDIFPFPISVEDTVSIEYYAVEDDHVEDETVYGVDLFNGVFFKYEKFVDKLEGTRREGFYSFRAVLSGVDKVDGEEYKLYFRGDDYEVEVLVSSEVMRTLVNASKKYRSMVALA